jgi:hypothetical protein
VLDKNSIPLVGWFGRAPAPPVTNLARDSQNLDSAVIGIDIGKNSFHVVGLDDRGAIVLCQKCSRGQIEVQLANMPPCPDRHGGLRWRTAAGHIFG